MRPAEPTAAAVATTVLRDLSRELRELDIGDSVRRVPRLTALDFLRDYVGSSKPVVVTNAAAHWPALRLWTPDYLAAAAGASLVTVALTPDGLADAPAPLPDATPAFVLPCQRRMPLAAFLALLQRSLRPAAQGAGALVPYLQFQNSSLTAELPELLRDVDRELPWASQAFGAPPEAVNVWIGGARSVTSWHRDHYENLYAVVSGYKTFRLLPPGDAYRLRLRRYPVASYEPSGDAQPGTGGGEPCGEVWAALPLGLRPVLHEPREEVLWSSILPEPLTSEDNAPEPLRSCSGTRHANPDALHGVGAPLPLAGGAARPLQVTVGPGEVLYLPACWWHEVHQHAQPFTPAPGARQGGDETSFGSGPSSGGAKGGGGSIVIAVNYWYDMRYDAKYAFCKAAEALAVAAGLNEAPPP